jgi:hypothetical protein
MCKDITKPCRGPPYVTDITKYYSCILEQYIKGPPYVTRERDPLPEVTRLLHP